MSSPYHGTTNASVSAIQAFQRDAQACSDGRPGALTLDIGASPRGERPTQHLVVEQPAERFRELVEVTERQPALRGAYVVSRDRAARVDEHRRAGQPRLHEHDGERLVPGWLAHHGGGRVRGRLVPGLEVAEVAHTLDAR